MSSALVMVRQHLFELNKRGDGLEDGRTRRERGELGRRGGEARRVARYSCVQLTTVYPALIEVNARSPEPQEGPSVPNEPP
jgi:hypothetical protein